MCVAVTVGWHLLLSDHGLVFVDVFTDDSVADRMFCDIVDLRYVMSCDAAAC